MIVLGIDGGASKTHAVLADERGRVLGVGHAPARVSAEPRTHYQSVAGIAQEWRIRYNR